MSTELREGDLVIVKLWDLCVLPSRKARGDAEIKETSRALYKCIGIVVECHELTSEVQLFVPEAIDDFRLQRWQGKILNVIPLQRWEP